MNKKMDYCYRRNIFILFVTTFLSGLVFYTPIYALYLQDIVLSIYKVSLLFAANSIAIIILEIPTGVISDKVGRKNSLLFSAASGIIAIGLMLTAKTFESLLIAILFRGLSYTFTSGTETAFIFENIRKIKQNPPSFKKMTAIHNSLWPVGASLSSIIGSILASSNYRYAFIASLITSCISFLLHFIILEEKSESVKEKGEIKKSFETIQKNRQLKIISLVGFFSYSFEEVLHQLKPVYF